MKTKILLITILFLFSQTDIIAQSAWEMWFTLNY